MPLSGRQAGSTFTSKEASRAIAMCAPSESVGSSVVHTTTTLNRLMMPRALNQGSFSLSLHFSQT